MYCRSCICFLLFVFVAKTSHANIDTYFEVNTFFYSEPVAINSLKTGWNTPIQNGDIIFTTDRFELGVSWQNWQLGLQYRYDYYFNFTPETANLIHSSKNKIELIPGQQYPINLHVNGVRTRGFKLARSITIKQGLSISSAFTLLEGIEFMSGGLWGEASAVSAKDYNVDFEVDYAYSKDPVFE